MKRSAFSPRRSSSLRFGVLIAAVFLAANATAFAAAYFFSERDFAARARQGILEEVASFVAAYRHGGTRMLSEEIRIHTAAAKSGSELFILFGKAASGQVGNAAIRHKFTGWRDLEKSDLVAAPGVDLADRYIAYGRSLGDQVLIIAQSTASLEELSEIFSRTFLAALIGSTLIGVAATGFFVWRAERRIGVIAGTLDAVSEGDYGARIQDAGAGADDLSRISAAINAMLDRLERNIAGMKQVSADIAHDLKTPLQRLRATLEALNARDGDPRAMAAVAEDAIGQADRIARTFQALLRITQIEGGSPKARFHPVDFAEVCESVVEVFQPAIEDAGHSFATRIAGDPPVPVVGDRELLAQMLSNLLENAMRHAPPPASVAVTLSATAHEAVLEVSDSGPGIPAEERTRVFRRLYRLERSRTSEGSGLGLTLVAAVVELHGGTVALEDNAPGLRVIVRLPLGPGEPPAA